MSIPFMGRRARRSALALISAGAVVTSVLGGVPAATAAGEKDNLEPSRFARPVMEAGRYIVLLKAPAATSYRGGDSGLAATRVAPGKSFDAQAQEVREYAGHLRSEQRALARSVGASVQTSYTIAANGFAARLTGKQASLLAADKSVLLVSKDVARKADTWNTPDFLGLRGKDGAWRTEAGSRRAAGQGTVVGVIDSGIWPDSPSFRGLRLTESPRLKWDISRDGTSTRMEKADGGVFTGECQTSNNGVAAEQWAVTDCNTKLIGARYYPDAFVASVPEADYSETEVISTRDGGGHGSHTASTAAGQVVKRVAVEGTKFGTVSGMAPGARIAAYKVCFDDNDDTTGGCYTSSILDAVDDAVSDGVDTINFSISGAVDTVVDPVEFAFEGAAEAGIFVAVSAGNSGPTPSTVAHNSPWLTTVAAATHVNFENTVVLGNGKKFKGASISSTPLPQTPVVESTSAAAAGVAAADATLCLLDSLDPAEVEGKIVLCSRGVNARVEKSEAVADAGGVGMILANVTEGSLDADFHSVPTIHINETAGAAVFRYVANAGADATAAFKIGDRTGGEPTPLPQVAGFSSRGPALANDGDLLKPDIAAPGASVLAAVAPPSNSGRDYDLYSGTSMSSPHIAGLANFIMAEHPQWTPMQVKSAMMTTATNLRNENGGRSKDLFAQGAGHVTPKRFSSPGLFVTSGATEWRRFIVGQGVPIGDLEPLAAKDLNGPSMADSDVVSTTSFTRRFVSDRRGTWDVRVKVPGFKASTADTLVAKRKGDRESLTIDFTRTDAPFGEYAKGYLTLSGPTRVRLPIVLEPVQLAAPAEVQGEGVTGSTDVTVTSADTGVLPITPNGLAMSDVEVATVATGGSNGYCMTLGADARVHRFDLDAANNAADLDLYVYAVTDATCTTATAVYQSATGAADEQVTIEDPESQFYAVFVDGYSTAPGETLADYRLDTFDVPTGPAVGDLTATPNPLPVTTGEDSTYEASWSGLVPDARYMGVFDYDGTEASTFITVDTRTVG